MDAMTALQSLVPTEPRRLKIAAIALLAIPAAVLALFAVAETVGGDVSGLQHVPDHRDIDSLIRFWAK